MGAIGECDHPVFPARTVHNKKSVRVVPRAMFHLEPTLDKENLARSAKSQVLIESYLGALKAGFERAIRLCVWPQRVGTRLTAYVMASRQQGSVLRSLGDG